MQQQQQQASTAAEIGFELEDALFSTAPIGVHCVDANGRLLWANQKIIELNLLGFTIGMNVEQYVCDNDKTLYAEVLKQVVVGGNRVNEIHVSFISRSGTIIHLLLDCDGVAIPLQISSTTNDADSIDSADQQQQQQKQRYYYRFFTRDDTPRRIQEMRSNVLFQETNRSLQMLDNFMNRSMQQMRTPLTLLEGTCNLVTENIEDIEEVIRRSAVEQQQQQQQLQADGSAAHIRRSCSFDNLVLEGTATGGGLGAGAGGDQDNNDSGGKPSHASPPTTNPRANNNNTTNLSTSSLAVALSATLEARSVVGLASTLTKDALALVDDITDLCRFDRGRVLLIDKEAVKVRDVCLESLSNVPIPIVGSGGLVDVVLDIKDGTPERTVTDLSVLQRSLALLLNFAVDAAANAVSSTNTATTGQQLQLLMQQRGKVILSVQDAASGQPQGTASACKISVLYTNPLEKTLSNGGVNIMGAAMSGGIGDAAATTAFASAYTRQQQQHLAASGNHHSMMRRLRLREEIESGMTGCRRDKLGLGLSLLYHLVGAQGSDLRYEIVNEQPPPSSTSHSGQQNNPSMTKFWFLLPMSLDFPGCLPAEYIVKDDVQGGVAQTQPTAIAAPILSSFAVAPDDGNNPQKRARLNPPQPQPQHPLNSILPTNMVIGAMMGNASLYNNNPESSSINAISATAASATAGSSNTATVKAATTTTKSKYPGVAPGARPLVLVVDDTDVSASLLCMHLRKLNCSSHRAENGEVAIEMLRSAPSPQMYSLILMDLRMPVMDGFEATGHIKGFASNIPVVALTGETSEENIQRCREIGFDDYKTKPLKRPQLKELLNKLVPGYTSVD